MLPKYTIRCLQSHSAPSQPLVPLVVEAAPVRLAQPYFTGHLPFPTRTIRGSSHQPFSLESYAKCGWEQAFMKRPK